MKINKLIQLCKRADMIMLYEGTDGVQWLGDGCAVYPLLGLPKFNEESFCATYGIAPAGEAKERVHYRDGLPEGINFADTDLKETVCDRGPLSFSKAGRLAIPYRTQQGIVFINGKYLNPLIDVAGEMELYERTTEAGQQYFAVKVGLILYGVIMPFNVIDKEFVSDLESVFEQCKVALFNKSDNRDGIGDNQVSFE